jgi:fructokinase
VIVVAGESLVDLIVDPDGRVATVPGGGPFNTACRLGRLGAAVAFVGRLSTDHFGRVLRRRLEDAGVDLRLTTATPDPTMLAVASLDRKGTATYRFSTIGTAATGLRPDDVGNGLPTETRAIHVGTLGLVFDPIATTIEGLVAAASDRVLVMVDPNCRPAAVDDRPGYLARLHRILRRADVVKVSVDDLAFIETELPPLDAARSLLNRGPRVVLLTDGARPVRGLTTGGQTEISVPKVDVVDTVGAGDAFSAGFLGAWGGAGPDRSDLAGHDQLVAATRRAVAVAADSTTVAGG